MKRISLLIALGAAVAVVPGSTAATVQVSITATGFVPAAITVNSGDTVSWTNNDTRNRQVVSQEAGFSSPVLVPRTPFSFTFNQAGTFRYNDALVPGQVGTVTVRPSVFIRVSPTRLTYGRRVVLSGRLENERANQTISILARECPATTFTKIGEVRTATEGVWGFNTKPAKHTTYRAQWGNLISQDADTRVRPRIRLSKLAPNRYRVRVFAGELFADKTVAFRRWNPKTRKWAFVRRVTLFGTGLGVAPTQISGRDFRSTVPRGQRLRITMNQKVAGGCLHNNVSNIIRS